MSGGAVVIRYRCAGHFQIFAAQKEQQSIARQTHQIRDENELNGSFWFQFESFEKTSAEKDADARTGHSDRAGENARLTFAQAELCFQIFRQEHDKSGYNHEFHASAETGHDINRIRYETPHRQWNVFDVLAVSAVDFRVR